MSEKDQGKEPRGVNGVIRALIPLTETTKRVLIGCPPEYRFSPGQHVALRFPGGSERFYFSFASAKSSDAPGEFELLVGTSKNNTELPFDVGTTVELSEAGGAQLLTNLDAETPLVLIGMGTGIAPLRSLVQAEENTNPERSLTLLAGAKAASELPYYEEFLAHAARGKLRFIPVFSRESSDGRPLGRVQSRLSEVLTPGAFFVICGSVKMVEETKRQLLKAGVTPTSIHGEGYGA